MADLVADSWQRAIDGASAALSIPFEGRLPFDIQPPRYPDVLVFGPEGPDPLRPAPFGYTRMCAPCGVWWVVQRPGNAERCWNCGGPMSPMTEI